MSLAVFSRFDFVENLGVRKVEGASCSLFGLVGMRARSSHCIVSNEKKVRIHNADWWGPNMSDANRVGIYNDAIKFLNAYLK